MSYLRGPLTREQITRLMAGSAPSTESAGPAAAPIAPPSAPASAPAPAADETSVVPQSAGGVPVRFLSPSAPWGADAGVDATSSRHSAAVVTRVELLFDDERAGIRHSEQWEAVVHPLAPSVDPAAAIPVDYDERDFLTTPPPGAVFVLPDAPIGEKRFFVDFEQAIGEYLYRSRTTTVYRNPDLKLYSRVGETEEEFAARCAAAADAAGDEAAAKLRSKYEARLDRAREALGVAEGRLDQATASAEAARNDEYVRGAGSVLDVFLGGRRSLRSITTALGGAGSRRGRASTAKARVDAAGDRVTDKRDALERLEQDLSDELLDLAADWDEKAASVEPVEIPLEKTDVRVSDIAVLWLPVPSRLDRLDRSATTIEGVAMAESDPSQIHRDFESRFNAADIDGLVDLYEPDATLIPAPGAQANGLDEIREALKGFLAMQGQISLDTKLVVAVDDLAYLSNTWSLEGKDADGNPVTLGATTAEVARRQDDGRWLYVIDNAWGDAAVTSG